MDHKRLHPFLYAAVALIAVSAAVANVVLAFSAPAADVKVFEAVPAPAAVEPPEEEAEIPVPEVPEAVAPLRPETRLAPPIADALRRVTKKPFGIEIHPETSPVPNDRFNGYHVGVDFEILEGEEDVDVPIAAACEGPLLFKRRASGYGGVAVQSCRLDREVIVIYGHLRLESIGPAAGERLQPGQRIGVLGKGHSEETDGVRKHLHFGLHESATSTDIRGYVKDEAELGGWLDALEYLR